MKLTDLMRGLTGHGRRRAIDRIPELTAERDYWQALAEARREQLAHADRLITKVCQEKSALRFEAARAAAELDVLTEAHRLLEVENDELAARLIEVRADLANQLAIHSPAPADHGPAIPLPRYDPDRTEELTVRTLWDMAGVGA